MANHAQALVFAMALGSPASWATNLITDGASFEVGMDGCALALQAGRLHRECASVLLDEDRTTAAHGARSLRFTRPSVCRGRYGLFYKPIALQPGKSHTLTAYLKSPEPSARMGLLLGGFPPTRGPGLATRPSMTTWTLTTEWARYEMPIPELPPSIPAEGAPGSGLYYVAIVPGESGTTFWIDGVQLEAGKATPFTTGKAVEVSLASNRPDNTFFIGEEIVPVAIIFAPKAGEQATVSCRAIDALGREVATSQKRVDLSADGHATVELPGFSLPHRAWLTIGVTVSCGGHEEKEWLCAAILEKLPPPQAQPCEFGFDFNSLASPDDLGAGVSWHAGNLHLSMDRVFRLATQSGVRWLRAAEIFFWDNRRSCEVSPGEFIFYDAAIRAAKGYGLALMGTLGNANAREDFCPSWARSEKKSRLAPIPTEEAWRRYVRTVVGHYKADIRFWEIINEPNTALAADDYLPLLKVAHAEAKAADPGCTIIGICATSGFFGDFFDPFGYARAVAEAGGLSFLDAVSGHTFCKPRPWQSRAEMPSWEYMAELSALFRRCAPQKALGFWNTEGVKYGSWTGRPNIPHTTAEAAASRMNKNLALPQKLAAAYAVRDCVVEFCAGAHVLFLWEFRNTLHNANIAFAGALALQDWFGFDGTPHAKFVALNALAEKLQGAHPAEHFGLSAQVRCAVFDRPQGPFALVWRENRDEADIQSYTLSLKGRLEAQDMFARPLPPAPDGDALEVLISETPVYLVAAKETPADALATTIRDAASHVAFAHDKPLGGEPVGPRRAKGGKRR
ncbi:MAG TPA: hypothetical protein PLU30_07705 [Verrucomicrobiae bacterium]|nr:hypothetical protein [Verrucomicrobiae bacterium]